MQRFEGFFSGRSRQKEQPVQQTEILTPTLQHPLTTLTIRFDSVPTETLQADVEELHRRWNGLLTDGSGRIEEDEIKKIASYYTPTPGGVGPVNVAMLLENLIKATENQKNI